MHNAGSLFSKLWKHHKSDYNSYIILTCRLIANHGESKIRLSKEELHDTVSERAICTLCTFHTVLKKEHILSLNDLDSLLVLDDTLRYLLYEIFFQ